MKPVTGQHLSDWQTTNVSAFGFHGNVSVPGQVNSAQHFDAAIELRYQRLATDPRLFQFANIPGRIIRCLSFFGVARDKDRLSAALLAYYIFIGVTDEAIDGGERDGGEEILARLASPFVSLSQDIGCSDAEFMAEILKLHFPASSAARIRKKFGALYKINLKERHAGTMRVFAKTRRLLGSVTADISYWLIRDHLSADVPKLRRVMKQAGAVGCLFDSIVDARDDLRTGLLSFRPSFIDWLFLCAQIFVLGAKLSLSQPRLIPLFADAIADNIRDRRRSGRVNSNGNGRV